ncbi:hypothetical protein AGLY_001569 [Aphis glycines]|uniref:Uncharacterized protein n=1 Tax=Aphis glycines TaxID=307491 RepID=A0A6G0U6I9_APHGL|nr:hypothetical protein AGLY_001569 [Aphis glycines]
MSLSVDDPETKFTNDSTTDVCSAFPFTPAISTHVSAAFNQNTPTLFFFPCPIKNGTAPYNPMPLRSVLSLRPSSRIRNKTSSKFVFVIKASKYLSVNITLSDTNSKAVFWFLSMERLRLQKLLCSHVLKLPRSTEYTVEPIIHTKNSTKCKKLVILYINVKDSIMVYENTKSLSSNTLYLSRLRQTLLNFSSYFLHFKILLSSIKYILSQNVYTTTTIEDKEFVEPIIMSMFLVGKWIPLCCTLGGGVDLGLGITYEELCIKFSSILIGPKKFNRHFKKNFSEKLKISVVYK